MITKPTIIFYVQLWFDVFIIILYSIVFCKSPRVIDNAVNNAFVDQQTFDVGSEVEYRCKDGFTMRGFARAKCLAMDISASWFGPDITCERKFLIKYIIIIKCRLLVHVSAEKCKLRDVTYCVDNCHAHCCIVHVYQNVIFGVEQRIIVYNIRYTVRYT